MFGPSSSHNETDHERLSRLRREYEKALQRYMDAARACEERDRLLGGYLQDQRPKGI
jgi:hypothetical protein